MKLNKHGLIGVAKFWLFFLAVFALGTLIEFLTARFGPWVLLSIMSLSFFLFVSYIVYGEVCYYKRRVTK